MIELLFLNSGFEPVFEAGFFADGRIEEGDFENRLRVLMNVPRVNVVVAHEGFDSAKDGFLWVA